MNISSIGARTGGVAASSVYAATKAGIIAITKSYARTLAPGVTVNAIAPGVVDTEMMRIPSEQVAAIVDQIPLGRLADPEEIASVVVFLASQEASYFTGATSTSTAAGSCIRGAATFLSPIGRATFSRPLGGCRGDGSPHSA